MSENWGIALGLASLMAPLFAWLRFDMGAGLRDARADLGGRIDRLGTAMAGLGERVARL